MTLTRIFNLVAFILTYLASSLKDLDVATSRHMSGKNASSLVSNIVLHRSNTVNHV